MRLNSPTSFYIWSINNSFSNLYKNFPSSTLTQIQLYIPTTTQTFQLHSFRFHFELSNFSFFRTAFSNNLYPLSNCPNFGLPFLMFRWTKIYEGIFFLSFVSFYIHQLYKPNQLALSQVPLFQNLFNDIFSKGRTRS